MNLNLRIHRLHHMQYRQKPNDSLDDYITRAKTIAQKCDFTDVELSGWLRELIIFSTPYDAFRNKLYSKLKGYSIANVFTKGRKYETLTTGNDQLNPLGMPKAEKMYVNRSRNRRNSNINYEPRHCPAYNDECSACGSKGHWARWCRKIKHPKEARRQSRHHRSKSPNCRHHNQRRVKHRRPRGKENKDVGSDKEDYLQHFHSITVSAKWMDSITGQPRDEAYTTLNIRPPPLKYRTHHVKIDSGTSHSGHSDGCMEPHQRPSPSYDPPHMLNSPHIVVTKSDAWNYQHLMPVQERRRGTGIRCCRTPNK